MAFPLSFFLSEPGSSWLAYSLKQGYSFVFCLNIRSITYPQYEVFGISCAFCPFGIGGYGRRAVVGSEEVCLLIRFLTISDG